MKGKNRLKTKKIGNEDNFNYLKRIESFDENNLPSLWEVVLGALELFEKEELGELNIPKFKKAVIVGSGNAIATAKILFDLEDVIFADETNYMEKINIKDVDGVILFSASGGKHAPIIAKYAKNNKKEVYLVTCTKNSPAEKIVGRKNTLITKKNREPYTYNTSTYLGWILAFSREDPTRIKNFILNRLDKQLEKIDFGLYDGFLFAIPNQFELHSNLFNVKFVELFGRQVARDIYTFESLKHAVTVVPSKSELSIAFGDEDYDFLGDRLILKLPKKIGPGFMLAIGYYVIGKIQDSKKQYFKENIKEYIKRLNKTKFGKGMGVIV